jgi:carboxypeptidase T
MLKIDAKAVLLFIACGAVLLAFGWIGGVKTFHARAAVNPTPLPSLFAGLPAGNGPWVVRAYFSDPQMVKELASRLEPWEVHADQGYLVAEVTLSDYLWMQAAGFHLEIDQALTQRIQSPLLPLPGQTSGIPGYPCYRTVEETYATGESLAQAYPHLTTWIDIGDSWEKAISGGSAGYDLGLLRLTNDAIPGPKPGLFIMSSVHAREYAPAELNTRFAEYLLANYNVNADITWLLDYTEIHLLFQANPDGRKKAEAGLSWRKNTDNQYCTDPNSLGVDLNRNFPFDWGCCGGSSNFACSEVYRGPSAASEPETQAIRDYVRSNFPDQRNDPLTSTVPANASGVFIDLHSYGQLVLWPWGFTGLAAPNGPALQTLGRKLAYFNSYTPEQAINLYPTDGTSDDFAYGELGLAAYTIEMGTNFFQDCSGFENTIFPNNLQSLLYAAKSARLPYLTPSGPDVLNLASTPALISPGSPVTITAALDDTRYNITNGSEPVQNIAAGEYSLDTPPWIATVVTHPFSAIDGDFNASVENVTASLDTTGMSAGRHILYARGRDAAGNYGPVSAAFIYVLFPQKVFLTLVAKGVP